MPYEDGRLIFTNQNGDLIPEKWSDPCSSCGHSRADHLVDPMAVTNVFAVSDCNYGKVMQKDELEAKPCGCVKYG